MNGDASKKARIIWGIQFLESPTYQVPIVTLTLLLRPVMSYLSKISAAAQLVQSSGGGNLLFCELILF